MVNNSITRLSLGMCQKNFFGFFLSLFRSFLFFSLACPKIETNQQQTKKVGKAIKEKNFEEALRGGDFGETLRNIRIFRRPPPPGLPEEKVYLLLLFVLVLLLLF